MNWVYICNCMYTVCCVCSWFCPFTQCKFVHWHLLSSSTKICCFQFSLSVPLFLNSFFICFPVAYSASCGAVQVASCNSIVIIRTILHSITKSQLCNVHVSWQSGRRPRKWLHSSVHCQSKNSRSRSSSLARECWTHLRLLACLLTTSLLFTAVRIL